ncbi:PREDICTED: uncharacterized protein LOC107185334 [Dufourea novaeangliae]|uniref:uncharacterized protein LOC107185334 n=1 Tax=Dufourea novaeangliae TaxID=178035 RepID=UPI000766F7B7|nr:PREDICTED: uncharacterized protein LOC107185334 [Dufourea novaeangliae]
MQNSSLLQINTERPSALVCIAYRQVSTMTGAKNPAEQPKVEEMNEAIKQNNVIMKKRFGDLKINSMESFLEFSKDMMESLRSLLEELKIRFEQFREQQQNIFDYFSLSNLQKLTQREQ